MIYDTFYAKLVPNGAVTGTKYSVSISGVTAIIAGQKTYTGADMYFAITPKSSGNAIVTFKNDTTGDIIGTRNILVRSTTRAKPTYKLTTSATTVNEGGTINFTLDTSDVLPNTNVGYKISGVNVGDISLSSLTGNFKIGPDGTSTLTITINENQIKDDNKTLKLELTSDATIFKEVTVVDTSVIPEYVNFKVGIRYPDPQWPLTGYVYNKYDTSANFGEELFDNITNNSELVNVNSLYCTDSTGVNTLGLFINVENITAYTPSQKIIAKLTRVDTNEQYISPPFEQMSATPDWRGLWGTLETDITNVTKLKSIFTVDKLVRLELTTVNP